MSTETFLSNLKDMAELTAKLEAARAARNAVMNKLNSGLIDSATATAELAAIAA